MDSLNLPAYTVRVKMVKDKQLIFDSFRKKFVALTPEEWVRQHFLHWLCRSKGFPAGLIAVEVPLKYNNLQKRADAVLFDKFGNHLMIVECKASTIQISQSAIEQIAMYNWVFGVSFLAITNGLHHYFFKRDSALNQWYFIDDMPSYEELQNENTR